MPNGHVDRGSWASKARTSRKRWKRARSSWRASSAARSSACAKAYNLSLSDLSEQSGVAKSIISQIERNETNPTLSTIWRLAQALDVSIERVLQGAQDEPFIEKSSRGDTPILLSEDGKCRLAITGWIKTVEWLQWYDFSADPGGVLNPTPINAAP